MAKKRGSRVLEEERKALMKSLSVKEFALPKEC
jgi:DNA-directed RNA polymerase subunit H (RpoH/RPB5)